MVMLFSEIVLRPPSLGALPAEIPVIKLCVPPEMPMVLLVIIDFFALFTKIPTKAFWVDKLFDLIVLSFMVRFSDPTAGMVPSTVVLLLISAM